MKPHLVLAFLLTSLLAGCAGSGKPDKGFDLETTGRVETTQSEDQIRVINEIDAEYRRSGSSVTEIPDDGRASYSGSVLFVRNGGQSFPAAAVSADAAGDLSLSADFGLNVVRGRIDNLNATNGKGRAAGSIDITHKIVASPDLEFVEHRGSSFGNVSLDGEKFKVNSTSYGIFGKLGDDGVVDFQTEQGVFADLPRSQIVGLALEQ